MNVVYCSYFVAFFSTCGLIKTFEDVSVFLKFELSICHKFLTFYVKVSLHFSSFYLGTFANPEGIKFGIELNF